MSRHRRTSASRQSRTGQASAAAAGSNVRYIRTSRNSSSINTARSRNSNKISRNSNHSGTIHTQRPVLISPRYSVVNEEEEEEEGYDSTYSDLVQSPPPLGKPVDLDTVPRIDGTESLTYKPVLERLAESSNRKQEEYRLPSRIGNPRIHRRGRHAPGDTIPSIRDKGRQYYNLTGITVDNFGDFHPADTAGQYFPLDEEYGYPEELYNDHSSYHIQQQHLNQRQHHRPSTHAIYNQRRVEFEPRRVYSEPQLQGGGTLSIVDAAELPSVTDCHRTTQFYIINVLSILLSLLDCLYGSRSSSPSALAFGVL